MKFLADQTLGKLVKWLRILGYDTSFHQGAIDRTFLQRGFREGRVVLTRRRDMSKRNFSGEMFIIYSDSLPEQIGELKQHIDITVKEDSFLSRCLLCNELLVFVEKTLIRDRVPPYVYNTERRFMTCPRCKRLFWNGTHRKRISTFLEHSLN